MSLVWHIVRKDFRRLRWPLLLWLLLPLAHWMMLSQASRTGGDPAEFGGMSTLSNTWMGLTWGVGLILATWLVMEDGLVSTKAFWRTRPVSGGRLLAAKVLGAILMFGVLPVAVMTPVWLAGGFSGRDWVLAALELSLKQGIFTVTAFTLASVTETAGQLLVRLIGAAVLGPLTVGFCAGVFAGGLDDYVGEGWTESRYRVVMAVFFLTPLVMVVHQYLTQRRERSYVLAALGVALMFGLRFGWQWDLTPYFRSFPEDAAVQNQGINFQTESVKMVKSPMGNQFHSLRARGTVAGAPAGSYVSFDAVRAWWGDGEGRRPGAKLSNHMGAPGQVAARQTIEPAEPAAPPVAWYAGGFERDETMAWIRAHSARLQIAVRAHLMRAQRVGELPLREGAILKTGSSSTRITRLERIDGRLVISLDERSAWPPWSARSTDTYALGIPAVAASGGAVTVTVGDPRVIQFASISFRQRQLTVDIPTHEVNGRIVEIPGWEESAQLQKITISPQDWFTQILPVELAATEPR